MVIEMQKKAVNLELPEDVYKHLKAQPQMSAYITELVRRDKGKEISFERRLELLESAVKRFHIKIDGIECKLGGHGYTLTDDDLKKFRFDFHGNKESEEEFSPFIDQMPHIFALRIDEGHFYGTGKLNYQSGETMPYVLEIQSVKILR